MSVACLTSVFHILNAFSSVRITHYDHIWTSCFLQEPRRPTPSVVAHCSAAEMVFDADNVELETLADGVSVSRPKDVFSALSSVLAMHWVFDIAYGPRLRKCLEFVTNYVCKLEPSKPSVAVQRRLNMLYS